MCIPVRPWAYFLKNREVSRKSPGSLQEVSRKSFVSCYRTRSTPRVILHTVSKSIQFSHPLRAISHLEWETAHSFFVCTRWYIGPRGTHCSPLPQTADQIIIHPPCSSVPVDRHHSRPPPPSTATLVDCHPRRLSMLLSAATVDCRRHHTSSPQRAVVYIAALPLVSTFIIVACHRDGVKS